uniref:SEA domain-containing protein n=1 Tax=Odontella aurita TaxID=265563 RepID=A0A7S4N1S6_9STRA|mmetsp:Transcript_4392/g.12278  ORF Transcript_4392/g.12278 Transcript_4392/m.12278 type:complete len:436 (+) Transcript_4392:234-1541(+)
MLKLIFLLAFSFYCQVDGSSETSVRLEPFTLNLNSKSKPETGDYLVLLRKLTGTHLEKKIKTEITVETLGDDSIEFSHVELLMKALTLDKDIGGRRALRRELETSATYISKATFEGSAFFSTDNIPDESVLYDVQLQAFSGAAKKDLLNDIQAVSDEPFLANARDLSVTFGVVPSGHSPKQDITDEGEKSSRSSLFPMIIGVGAGIFLLAVGTILWQFRQRTPSYLTKPAEEPRKESEKDFGELEINSTRSPSPPPSISSMDSSKFTYNEAGGTFKSAKSSSKGSRSCNNTIDLNMNVDAWQNAQEASENLTFAVEDISVIQKHSPQKTVVMKKESRTAEGNRHKMLPENSTASTQDTSYLSRDSVAMLDTKGKFEKHSVKYQGRLSRPAGVGCRQTNLFEESICEDEIGVETSDSDVISDLKNLSVQINHHRAV